MKVLVVNCGSSSLKYQVLEMPSEELLCKGLVERIGIEGAVIKHEKIGMDKFVLEVPMKNHEEALGHVIDAVLDAEHGVAGLGRFGRHYSHASGDPVCTHYPEPRSGTVPVRVPELYRQGTAGCGRSGSGGGLQ